MAEEPQQDSTERSAPLQPTWREFLESFPVNNIQAVSDYWGRNPSNESKLVRLTPILRLYCFECQGIRNFDGRWDPSWINEFNSSDFNKPMNAFLQYICKDCNKGYKTYALRSGAEPKPFGAGRANKLGEFPESYIEISQSLKRRLGEDYPLFLKGLTCENQGLGVGAFVYYRRVVESQKSQLIAEILKVAEKLGAPKEMRDNLARAANEKQFSRALEIVKDAIPEALLVNSHNPLKLLHDALSIGVHAEDDENCLKIAHGVRMVLNDFAERLKLALDDQAELRSAISDLFKFTSEAKKTRS